MGRGGGGDNGDREPSLSPGVGVTDLDGTLLAASATATIAITGEGQAAMEQVPVAPASDDLKIPRYDYDDDDGGRGGCVVISAPTGCGGSRSRCTKYRQLDDPAQQQKSEKEDSSGGGGTPNRRQRRGRDEAAPGRI